MSFKFLNLVVLYFVNLPLNAVTNWKPRKMLWRVIFAGFFVHCLFADKQCRVERSINGMALQGYVFKEFLVGAFLECNIGCEEEITCQSFNYVKGEKSCELNNRTKEARPENFRSDPARTYIRRLMGRGMLTEGAYIFVTGKLKHRNFSQADTNLLN